MGTFPPNDDPLNQPPYKGRLENATEAPESIWSAAAVPNADDEPSDILDVDDQMCRANG